jgi:hypothetical protein
MHAFYLLDLLPLQRFDDPTLTVAAARAKWNQTLAYVDEVRTLPVTLGGDVLQVLDNLRFYLVLGIRQLEAFVELRGSGLQTVAAVEGLDGPQQMFLQLLPKAQALFATWRSEAEDQVQLKGFGDDMTDYTQALLDFSKPKDESKLFLGLMVAGALVIAVYAARS